MSIAILLTIAKMWKFSHCPSRDEPKKKRCEILYDGLLFTHEKEGNFTICNKMNESRGLNGPDRKILYKLIHV